MFASRPIHDGLYSLAGITLPSLMREDGVANFQTARCVCIQIFRAGQSMKADVADHGFCFAQDNRALKAVIETGRRVLEKNTA